jgi:hypothetical protein
MFLQNESVAQLSKLTHGQDRILGYIGLAKAEKSFGQQPGG